MRAPTDDPFIRSVSLNRQFVSSFDEYPYSIPAIKNLHTLELHKNVTFFVGENGTGKSTLLEAMAVAEGFNAEGGSRHAMFKTRDTHSSDLARKLQLARPGRTLARSDSFFLRAESFYNLSSYVDDMPESRRSYGPIPLHEMSHGEAFLTLLTTRLGGNGLYLFDEPEAALSPQRQLTFLVGLHEMVEAGSQLIIATHSPIIMAYPNAVIYHFTTDGITPIAYEDTEHYKVTRAFLTRTEKMLSELLE